MKNVKMIAVSVITVIAISGCLDGVDKDKLAALTGNKNLEQVKESWKNSIRLEKEEDQKIYDYWLKKNGAKADPTFNVEMFEKQFLNEYKQGIDELKAEIKEIDKNVNEQIKKYVDFGYDPIDWRIKRELKNKKENLSWAAESSVFIKNTYIPFLEKKIKEIDEANAKIEKLKAKKLSEIGN